MGTLFLMKNPYLKPYLNFCSDGRAESNMPFRLFFKVDSINLLFLTLILLHFSCFYSVKRLNLQHLFK